MPGHRTVADEACGSSLSECYGELCQSTVNVSQVATYASCVLTTCLQADIQQAHAEQLQAMDDRLAVQTKQLLQVCVVVLVVVFEMMMLGTGSVIWHSVEGPDLHVHA